MELPYDTAVLLLGIQTSVSICGGLIPGPLAFTKIHECSSPILDSLYPWFSNLWIQRTLGGNLNLQLVESACAEPIKTEGFLYLLKKVHVKVLTQVVQGQLCIQRKWNHCLKEIPVLPRQLARHGKTCVLYGWIDKDVVYIWNGILFSYKKEDIKL